MAWIFLFTLYFHSTADAPTRFGPEITLEARAHTAQACEAFRAFVAHELIAFKTRHTIATKCEQEAPLPDLPEGVLRH